MSGETSSTADEEAAILAAIMTIDGGYDRVALKLRSEHFGVPLFGRIYEEMALLSEAGKSINIFTVSNAMSAEPAFHDLGGHSYWLDVANKPYVVGALAFADDLLSQARRRLLIENLKFATDRAADRSADLSEALQVIEEGMADAMPAEITGRTQRLGAAYIDAVRRVEALRAGEIEAGLCVYGWSDFNDLTGGIRPGEYLLVGGRPSMGKTALSLGIARRAAQAGHGVLYISREMSTTALMERMLADLLFDLGGEADMSAIRAGKVSNADLERLWRAQAEITKWPLVIDDPESLSAGQIAPLIRRHKQAFERRGENLRLVIIDYLGLVDPPPGRGNRQEEVTATSKAIKNAARSTGIPIIVLSQLSRAVEQREDKRPQLSDLRESGSLEQDADVVIFVYRDQYYLERAEPDPSDSKRRESWEVDMQAARDRIDIYTAKQRQGALVRRKGYFFGARQAIRNSDYYMTGGGY